MTMGSTSRMPPRKRLPMPSPVDEPATSPAMSTNSSVAETTFFDFDISASAVRRGSGTCAMPTWLSVVEKGWAATGTDAPVRALNSDDLPALGRPTRPRRSIEARVTVGEFNLGTYHRGRRRDLRATASVGEDVDR